VKGAQVEELYSLEEGVFDDLKPVYGLIFLFKWRSGEKDDRPISDNQDIFFANQVINNACATQAILSILLNCTDLELGEELTNFKTFTKEFPPELKGLAISNSELIRDAHNKFSPAPFIFGGQKSIEKDDDVYHFISYLHFDNKLWELDGLKAGPICLGDCTKDDWVDKARPVVYKRIEKYSKSEIRFNLMAIIGNRKDRYTKEIESLGMKLAATQERLSQLQQGTACDGTDNLPTTVDAAQASIQHIQASIEKLQQSVAAEEEKFRLWRAENVRRKHNYIPFIVNLLKILAEKGELVPLIEKAKHQQRERTANKTQKQ